MMLFYMFEQRKGTLKDQITSIKPILEDLRSRKKERIDEFAEVQSQIVAICAEIAGSGQSKDHGDLQIKEHDLTAKRLSELKIHLKELQSEKVLIVEL